MTSTKKPKKITARKPSSVVVLEKWDSGMSLCRIVYDADRDRIESQVHDWLSERWVADTLWAEEWEAMP